MTSRITFYLQELLDWNNEPSFNLDNIQCMYCMYVFTYVNISYSVMSVRKNVIKRCTHLPNEVRVLLGAKYLILYNNIKYHTAVICSNKNYYKI